MEGNTILLCETVAYGNPIKASDLCNKYGYSVDETDATHISETLHTIISNNANQQIIKEICDIHPDKDLILELYQPKDKSTRLNYSGSTGCRDCRGDAMMKNYTQYQMWGAAGNNGSKYYNATGNSEKGTFSNIVSMQTNTILILGIILIGGAIILKNKN